MGSGLLLHVIIAFEVENLSLTINFTLGTIWNSPLFRCIVLNKQLLDEVERDIMNY